MFYIVTDNLFGVPLHSRWDALLKQWQPTMHKENATTFKQYSDAHLAATEILASSSMIGDKIYIEED